MLNIKESNLGQEDPHVVKDLQIVHYVFKAKTFPHFVFLTTGTQIDLNGHFTI